MHRRRGLCGLADADWGAFGAGDNGTVSAGALRAMARGCGGLAPDADYLRRCCRRTGLLRPGCTAWPRGGWLYWAWLVSRTRRFGGRGRLGREAVAGRGPSACGTATGELADSPADRPAARQRRLGLRRSRATARYGPRVATPLRRRVFFARRAFPPCWRPPAFKAAWVAPLTDNRHAGNFFRRTRS